MHVLDVLKYGDSFMAGTLEAFPKEEVYRSGACGYWSVKDLVAHLGSFELILLDVLKKVLDDSSTPQMDTFLDDPMGFNDKQVNQRSEMSYEEVLAEYQHAHQNVIEAARKMDTDVWRGMGLILWYGEEYDLEDFVVYQYYGHKREHCGQIQVFSDQFK